VNILVVSSSQRENSKSVELALHLQKHILGTIKEIKSSVLDLSRFPYLLDNYGIGRDDDVSLNKNKDDVLSQLYNCDAIVFVVPEWGGMIPPALVNLLLLSANGSANGLPLGHKPAFAVGVSASAGGSNPISLLKGYAAKNTHLTWLPLHAIIHNVDEFLAHDWQPHDQDRNSQVQSRLTVGIHSLIIYAKQLRPVREELVLLSKIHPFGQ
jgi:NAD(P)H-dependent FMN reductase